MAILLIKDSDARMPTVVEWRVWMNSVGIPTAQKFLVDHPKTEKAMTDLKRWEEFRVAKGSLEAHLSGRAVLPPIEFLSVIKTISDYEASPLSEDERTTVVFHHVSTLDATTPNETDPRKWRGPSIADQWRGHKNLLEVEAIKGDVAKAAELAQKDLHGCYKRGDVVQVFEDGTPCIIPPAPPFYIIEVTGLSKALAEKYAQPEMDLTNPERPITLRRRKFGITVGDVPLAVRQRLIADRYVKVSWSTVRAYVRNKSTGVGE